MPMRNTDAPIRPIVRKNYSYLLFEFILAFVWLLSVLYPRIYSYAGVSSAVLFLFSSNYLDEVIVIIFNLV